MILERDFEHVIIGLNFLLSGYILLLAPRRRVNQLFALVLFLPYVPYLLNLEMEWWQNLMWSYGVALLYIPFEILGLAATVHLVLIYPKRTRLSLPVFKHGLLLSVVLYNVISLAYYLQNAGLVITLYSFFVAWLIYGLTVRILAPRTMSKARFWWIMGVGINLELFLATMGFTIFAPTPGDDSHFSLIGIIMLLPFGVALLTVKYMKRLEAGRGQFITPEQWANWGRWQIPAIYGVMLGFTMLVMALSGLKWEKLAEYTYRAYPATDETFMGMVRLVAISFVLLILWENYRRAAAVQRAPIGLLWVSFAGYYFSSMVVTTIAQTSTLNLTVFEIIIPVVFAVMVEVAIMRYHFLDSSLDTVTQIINSTLEIEAVLKIVIEKLALLVDFHNCGVLLLEGNQLVIRSSTVAEMVGHHLLINDTALLQEFAHKQPIVANKTAQIPQNFLQAMFKGGIVPQSWVGLPLVARDQVVGLISLSFNEPYFYNQADLDLLLPFACRVAVAVDNARLYELQKQRTTELTQAYQQEQQARQLADTLREVANVVGGTLNLDEVLQRVLNELNKVLPYDKATVLWRDGNKLYPRADCCIDCQQVAETATKQILQVDKYANINYIVTTGQPLIISDTTANTRWQSNPHDPTRAWVGLPLMAKGQVAGLLSIKGYTPHMYCEDDVPLVMAFANQVTIAIENARLYEMEIKQLEQELETARQIQMSLLPSTMPELQGLHLSAISRPARHVGGDFYNYFVFDSNCLGVAVGDVSGKGMQAALMMALSFGLLTNGVRRDTTPSALLNALNSELSPHTRHNRMNTALSYLTLERANGNGLWNLRVANAGLIAPLIRHRSGQVEWLDIGGLPLGMVAGVEYGVLQQTLAPGDLLVLSSDGIVEAMNPANEMYGFDRLVECLTAAPLLTALELQKWVLADVRTFVGQAEPHDDMTMVVVQV